MDNDTKSIEMHFDRDALYNKLGKNDLFFNELIELGVRDLIQLKILLVDFNVAKKEAKVRTVAHKLKGTAGSINLPILRTNIIELEDADFLDQVYFDEVINKICTEIDYLIEKVLIKI